MASKPLRPSLVILGTLLGNTLEWFEYLSFAFLAPVFALNFFPREDSWRSLSLALVGFSFGYILRPVGALIFGFLGDKYGRKCALIASIISMSIPTLVIGLLPTYAQIGFTAVVLLGMMRLLQGIATGGEFPSSMIFLVESAPHSLRSFYGSFAYVGMLLGVLIGGADFFILNHYFSDSISSWGWRSVYIFGALLGLFAFYLRSKLHETHPFEGLKEAHEVLKDPFLCLIRKYKVRILKVIFIQILQTVDFNLLISFSVVYFTEHLGLSDIEAGKLNLIFISTLFLSIIAAGLLGRRIAPKKIMAYSACGHIIFCYPLYLMLQMDEFRILSLLGFAILAGFYMSPSVAYICDLFPAKVRLSGVALGYNLSVSWIGGFTPLMALWMIHRTGSSLSPALFIAAGAVISLIVLITDRAPQQTS